MRSFLSFFILCFFGAVLCTGANVYANFDKTKNKNCTCSDKYYYTGWSDYSLYEQRQYQMKQSGGGKIYWQCSVNVKNGCGNPNCSSGSACAGHDTACMDCNYGGGVATGAFNQRPRWSCLATSLVNLANTHVVSANELPASYTLPQNFYNSIVSYTDETSGMANSNATKCEYACNVGYVRDTIGGVTQCRLARCNNNTGVDFSNTVVVAPAELPSTTPYTFTQDYAKTLVINGTNTADKCEYTCLNSYRADLSLTPKKCIPIVCTGNIASNGLKCAEDEANLSGNLDINRIRRANISGCTGPQKCEWYCPADKPVYCATRNECVVNVDDCGCAAGQKMCGNGQCIAGNLTCPTTTPAQCNNDGLCNNNESCDCSDCTNGDGDDTDHCKIGLRCTRDESQSSCTEAACCPLGMTWSCDSNACTNACGTHVPSELKAAIDIPFVTCDARPGSTHFRYQITRGSLVYTSDIYPSGTTVKHTGPLMDVGLYNVKCFYGTSSSTIDAMTPALCNKTIIVKSQIDSVQGCSQIYAYKGNTLSDEMRNNTAFDASFSCGSRLDMSAQNFPYKLTVGTQSPTYLQSDTLNSLGIGFVSLRSQKYTFSGATDVTCAVKVGDGYSTNNTCKIRTCVGTTCSSPQTFVVTPSKNALCTSAVDATYDIGCNENSPQYSQCVAWFYTGASQQVRVNNNPPQNLTCTTSTPPGALSPVKTCTVQLPSGGVPVTLFAGNADSFQTTIYSLTRDQQIPVGKLEFYTNYSSGTKLDASQYQLWQKQPVTAVVTCSDAPGSSDGGGCACAATLQENGTEQFWSPGRPHGDPKIGPDIMTYTRIFLNNSVAASAVRVRDTAGLVSSPIPVSIGVDTVPPKVTVTVPANNRFGIVAQDLAEGGSGLWKPASLRPLPAGITKTAAAPAILYKTFTKAAYIANPTALEFDEKCSLTALDNGDYYSFGQLTSAAALAAQTIPSTTVLNGIRSTYAATTSMVAYCVQDNAGNVTRGVYPSDPVGCFSASNMDAPPNLSNAKTLLATRLGNTALTDEKRYGYGLSEDLANASCFRSIVSSNINTLIANQFVPEVSADIAWDKSSYIKGLTPLKRNMSYYYYLNTTANPPTATATTLTPIRKIATSPTGTGVKTVLVDGENIQINSNITYTGADRVLVLIARKNTKGAGGNILIDPSVTRIDAILIADGAILNAVNGALRNSSNPAHASALSNRLTINGRLYSFNTRGGSYIAMGSTLAPATGTLGKYFQNNVLMSTTATNISKSSEQDLERFRMIFGDGNPQCSLHINYYVMNTANLPPVLERPANFTGGTCSF